MDDPIIIQAEFIPADKQPKTQKEQEEGRQHTRFSLRESNHQDIRFACDGVTVSLVKKYCLMSKNIGIANIKDIGLGGVGLISRCNLQPKQTIFICLGEEYFQIQVMRVAKINHKLNFIGARWTERDERQIGYITNKIYNLSRSPQV
ncbi:hypothetical protein L2719_17265 [Shewanella schlegeliana]|uniref:PilZ domain-containing protein n=1 Tax=Shewanella schlegeliana TaxID=190308 RepID=A0ABS1T347_9GAMM|nr:hypothetical protein [Shewanella schlegeliana]MBL4915202.1 hypothetical protein [Shewanella schlegeliana]MCL1111288.1 hypothetical protein [Shewanella schlegeliana]GIU37842.1 hypothetical protein TUM4433_38670 [Shewanella schlegeliana]